MLGNNFYHGIIGKSVTLFGNIFNDIKITRLSSSGKGYQTITVPILYGNKDKYISLFTARGEGNPKVQIELPRMSFSITNIAFDPVRKNNPVQKNIKNVNGSTVRTSFVEMPYNIDFELSIYTKSYTDSAQIVEQIAPFFTPDFNANVKLVPELDLDIDIKTTMTSMVPSIEFEGAIENTRIVTWILNFSMETYLIGPINKEGLIRKAVAGIYTSFGLSDRVSIEVTPGLTPDGLPTSRKEFSIPYTDIQPTDPYGFVTEKSIITSDNVEYPPVAFLPPPLYSEPPIVPPVPHPDPTNPPIDDDQYLKWEAVQW